MVEPTGKRPTEAQARRGDTGAGARQVSGRLLPLVLPLSVMTPLVVVGAQPAAGAVLRPGDSAQGAAASPSPSGGPRRLHTPNVLVTAPHELDSSRLSAVSRLHGVRASEPADAGRVTIDGHRALTLGVAPESFRAFTPAPTARSDALWNNVGSGDVAASFELGHDGRLPLAHRVRVKDAKSARVRVGAFATVGIGGVDAVVSHSTARSLGMPRRNALVISARPADVRELTKKLKKVLPKGSRAQPLGSTIVPVASSGTPGSSSRHEMGGAQIATALEAAKSRLGDRYVWGATGPNTFDCSGLVQWAYARAGIALPRVTDQQFLTGEHIPLLHARPGDLLFWRNDPTAPRYVSHVAIYLGDGKMIEAPHTGDVVKIVPVPVNSHFAGVVRIRLRG